MKQTQCSPTQRRFRLAQIAGETEKRNSLGREEVAKRNLDCGIGAAQQVRQALFAVEGPQAAGQVDAVPGLLELVISQMAMQLALENLAGRFCADLRESADLKHEVHARTQAGYDRRLVAALQKSAKAPLRGLDGLFIDVTALKNLEVLPRHRRKRIGELAPPRQMAAK